MGSQAERLLGLISEERAVELISGMTVYRSYTGHERELGLYLADVMRDLGLRVTVQEVAGESSNIIGMLDPFTTQPKLMLNGHIDIDPVVEGWTRDPFKATLDDGWVYGAGSVNMRAGNTAILLAVDALQRSDIDLEGGLMVAFVAGELQGGLGAIRMLEAGFSSEMAVVAEPTDLGVETLHAGIRRMRVVVHGQAAHLAYRQLGVNAILKAGKLLEAIEAYELSIQSDKYKGLPRINVGAVKGGISRECFDWRPSVVPDTCVLALDVRTPPDMTGEDVKLGMERLIGKLRLADPDLNAEVELLGPPEHYPRPCFETSPESFIVQKLVECHRRVTGRTPSMGDLGPIKYFGTDASHLQNAGISSVVYGPGDPKHMNRPDERVKVSDIITAARVYALLALSICHPR